MLLKNIEIWCQVENLIVIWSIFGQAFWNDFYIIL